MHRDSRRVRLAGIVGVSLLIAQAAAGVTLGFSDASSDTTPASSLAATVTYTLPDPTTLEIAVRNDTGAEAPFDITLLFFNTGADLDYVELVGAVSSLDGENTHAWRTGHYGYDLFTTRFGEFDFSLRTEPGAEAAHRIAPGETQHFTLDVHCAGYLGCGEDALSGWSEGGRSAARAALRFAYGPDGDAAFGALLTPVPEPGTALLVASGLAATALLRRRR